MPVRAAESYANPSSCRHRRALASSTAMVLCALMAITGAGPVAQAQPGNEPSAEQCPAASAPPPAVDTSEMPKPGASSPEPLPVPEQPIGGARLGACGLITPPAAPAPPAEVSAASWVLADLDSGEVLTAKEPHARHRPASTIKVLTALTAIRNLRMDDTLVATQADADQEGSKAGLAPGATYTLRQVVTGMIMQSGNDAAHALTTKLGGPDATLTKMNELAHKLGALDTRAVTPSGLDSAGMSSSAYDLAVIFRAAMADPVFAGAAATKHTELPGPPGQPPLPIESDNSMLMRYPGAIGAKSGFTDDARHTFIGAANRSGHRLIAVLTRGENQPIRQPKQATNLLDHGFALGPVTPVGRLVDPAKPPPTAEPQPQPSPEPISQRTSQQTGSSSWGVGDIGIPLVLLAAAVAILLTVLAVRKRRAKLAASSDSDATSNDAKTSDDGESSPNDRDID